MAGQWMARAMAGAALCGALLAGCSDKEPTPAPRTAPAGPRLVLTASDAVNWQDVSAEIASVDQAQVIARIPGILTTLSVREGDMVAKGQVIGRIVDSQLGFQAGAYGAQAAAAQAQAAQAQAELDRVRYLYRNGVYAKARLDQAESAAAAAAAQIRAARAQQGAVAAVAGQGAVIAPASGRVLRADIPAGAPVAPGMAIATITAGPAIVRLEMPESLAGKVHVGSRVTMDSTGTGTGAGNTIGYVARIYPAITAGRMTADVDVPGIDSRLIGRRVAAKVETGARKAMIVPKSFVVSRYGIDYVTVIDKQGASADIAVQTAASGDDATIEILSGASPGDTLVAAVPATVR